MVTKAIIEEIVSPYEVKVKIPILDSTKDNVSLTGELSSAIICTLPKVAYIPEVGDVVIITFEDNDRGKPIILGCLFKESSNISQVNITTNQLNVTGSSELSRNIKIGNISYNQLKFLEGLEENIQAALDNIEDRLKQLEGK